MKRLMVAGLLALAALVGSQQKASAWIKWNFNAGINASGEGGGNSLLWGLYQSSPYPGCGVPGYNLGPSPFNNTNCCQAVPAPALAYPAPCAAPGYPAAVAPVAPAPAVPHPVVAPVGQTAVHPVSYSAPGYYPYYQPYSGYYPAQVPSYWYGR
jgi:hypothetical protein